MKARRFLINRAPATVRQKLARTFLPPETFPPGSPFEPIPKPPMPLPVVVTAAEVVREARTWVGVSFRHQGRDRNGVDCIGLPIVVMQALNALPPDFEEPANYSRFPYQNNLQERLLKYCTKMPKPEPGCLISLTWRRTLAHVAILTDTDTLIHAFERAPHNGVIEHAFRGMWKTRFAPIAWAMPGVRYG
jgi:cell wall-associated NlpC family hydrolase